MTHACPLCGATANLEGFKVLLERNQVFVDGQPVSFAGINAKGKVAEVAAVLSEASPNTVSKERMMLRLYGSVIDPPENDQIVSVFICQLRKALLGTPYRIENTWGRGWRLVRREPEAEHV